MQRPPIARPWAVVCSAWPVRSLLYLVGYTVGGLVTWAALPTVVAFPVWASVWARVERRLAVLVGADRPDRGARSRAGVTWRELCHCAVSVPLGVFGVLGGLTLVAGALSTVFAPLQGRVPFDRLWWWTPTTATGYVVAALAGVLGLPIVLWLLTVVALGVETLSVGILAPRAELLARRVDTLREASLRAEDDVVQDRRRLQDHLHDGVQLHLSVTGTRLAVLEYDVETRVPEPHRDALLDDIAEVREQLQVAMTQVRLAVSGLAPRLLVDEGLGAALTDLAGRMPFAATVDCAVSRLPERVETDVYLIVSEALANAVKHARARSVAVTLRSVGERIVLSVVDDGIGGVDPEGRGILGMESRTARIGGTLTVQSPPLGGTSVVVEFPQVAP